MPREVYLLSYIDRFGAAAIMGRMLGAAEVRRMIAADNVVRAYRSRQESDNWSKWAGRNPGLSALLNEAMKLAGEDGD